MKKQNIINLIKYHTENNNSAFVTEAVEIAKEFNNDGDSEIAQFIMDLISNTNFYIPQSINTNYIFLQKAEYSSNPLLLPEVIEEDVLGIARAISNYNMNKFLFYGSPGTGKTESAIQIARMLNRELFTVSFEQLVDSKLGETAKNVVQLFDEINHLPYGKTLVLFDEIDSIILDRISSNDLREMGRVTSTFIREFEKVNNGIPIIATTNLINNFDKAILRRFDATVSFDRYTKKDLIEIADSILASCIKTSKYSKQDIRMFNKILSILENIPYPGDLKQIIRTSIAFSDENNEYDYLRKIFLQLNNPASLKNIKNLNEQGFTTREIEILSRIPKSSVSRKLKLK